MKSCLYICLILGAHSVPHGEFLLNPVLPGKGTDENVETGAAQELFRLKSTIQNRALATPE
jgi:hypothetical protein